MTIPETGRFASATGTLTSAMGTLVSAAAPASVPLVAGAEAHPRMPVEKHSNSGRDRIEWKDDDMR
jgi:hypothetical protein